MTTLLSPLVEDTEVVIQRSRHHGLETGVGVWWTASTVFLAGVFPLLVLAATVDGGRGGQAWQLALGVAIWSGARIAWLIGPGKPRLYEYAFWLFCYLFLGLAPMSQLVSNSEPPTTPGLEPSLDASAMGVIITGIVAFELAGMARHRARQRSRSARTGTAAVNANRSAVLAVAGLTFAANYVSKVSVSTLFSNRDALTRVRTELWPDPTSAALMLALASMPLLVAAHGLARARRTARGRGDRPKHGPLLILTLATLLVVVNPISSPRYVFGTVGLSLLVLANAFLTPRRARIAMVGILAGMILVFPVADAFRRSQVAVKQEAPLTQFQANPDYDAFGQIHNAIWSTDTQGLQIGQQALGVVFFWVPRSIWKEKPTDTGVLLAQERNYNVTNLSAPLWAELWINGGYLSLILGFFVLGWFLRRADKALVETLRTNGLSTVAGAILPFYLIIVLRGSLLQATGYLVAILACLAFIREPVRSPQLGLRF